MSVPFGRAAAVLGSVLWLSASGVALAQENTVTIIHVNDTHSRYEAAGPKHHHLEGTLGGLAKAASVIGYLEATEPNPLFLHAGDFMHGDFMFQQYFGVPELQVLQQLHCAAMASGNHEWDFGPDFLAMVLTEAFQAGGFPLLSANIDLGDDSPLAGFLQPSTMTEAGGVKIGIVGATTPFDPAMQMGSATMLGTDDPTLVLALVGEQVAALRGAGAQVVILLSHLGDDFDSEVAANVPGIDFIIGGHDHGITIQPEAIPNPTGGTTYRVEAGSFYEHVGKLTFTVAADGAVTLADYTLVPVDASTPKAPDLVPLIEQLRAGVVAQFGDVYRLPFGFALRDITQYAPEGGVNRDSPVGDLITDAYRQRTHTDIAMTAIGLLDTLIYRGFIVGNDLFHVIPYGFDEATHLGLRLATWSMTGADLLAALELTVATGGDFFIQVSGMRYTYDSRRPDGAKIVSVSIGGKPLDPARVYTVTSNSGAAALLPKLRINVQDLQILSDLEYNVVRNFVARRFFIDYRSTGRVKDLAQANRKPHTPL